jgi:hypothetical protein
VYEQGTSESSTISSSFFSSSPSSPSLASFFAGLPSFFSYSLAAASASFFSSSFLK